MSHQRFQFAMLMIVAFEIVSTQICADILVDYRFEGDTSDSSGFGLDGELIGDATIQDGRLALPGGLDNAMSIPLGEFSPFDGLTSWTIAFEFQTVDESGGALFSSDGSGFCEEDDDVCRDFWPDHEEAGPQTGSLNVFINEEGSVATDFWFIDVVTSLDVYNDDEPHSYVGSYDAETGEFIQTIDKDDEVFGSFVFERDASNDRTLIADESNGDFGFEFNPDGFHGFFDNFTIDSEGPLPEPGVPGDFDKSGALDPPDVNMLNVAIAGLANPPSFDLNGDNVVDESDLVVWVKDLRKSWIGDANLDGEFNTTDFVDVFQAGKFEQDVDAGWDDGDWTGDLRFNTSDFVAAFQDGGFEMGPRTDLQSVPEPSMPWVVLILGSLMCYRQQKRS